MSSDYENIEESPPRLRVSSGPVFAVALLAIGVLLGFTLGLTVGDPGLVIDLSSSSGLYDEGLVTSLVEDVSPGVVELGISRRAGGNDTSTGSGFLVDRQGHVVTNNHVVEGAEGVSVRLYDGRTLDATVLGTSPADDLALLQVNPGAVADIRPLELADSNDVVSGQMAIAIGSPFQNFNSVTVGVVSGTGRGPTSVLRRPIPDMIQTDAPLNPGNSGGPLLNSDGEVIGINSSIRTNSFSSVDEYRIGFAVPSNTFANLKSQLLEPRQVRRPWLGVSGGSVSNNLNPSLGLPSGIYVTTVFDNSPAERAGLVPFRSLVGDNRGDVITAVDGQVVESVEDMVSYFNTLIPGAEVTLTVFRDDESITVDVTLDEWPDT